jgi:hypothetical protein
MKPLYTHKTHSHQPLNINEYERRMATLNDRIASVITNGVSTMWCAYVFAILAIIGFPGLHASPTQYVQWVSQTFIQLVMLSILAVSQGQIGDHQQLVADEQFSTTTKTYQELEESRKHLDAQDAVLVAIHAEQVAQRRLLEQLTNARPS